jgi:small nuclear ribonucleoprotein (snRNP)-like protein
MSFRLLLALPLLIPYGVAQTTSNLDHVSHSSTFNIVSRDGSCVQGVLRAVDPDTLSLEPFKSPTVKLKRDDILQVSQRNALLYSVISSWDDVKSTHPVPREALVLTLRSGKRVKGQIIQIDDASISLKHGLVTTIFQKSEIQTVDYLRWRPESDGFDFMLEEAPYMTLFYPEFYYRTLGLEGRVPVRLYDISKPQKSGNLISKQCFPNPSGKQSTAPAMEKN